MLPGALRHFVAADVNRTHDGSGVGVHAADVADDGVDEVITRLERDADDVVLPHLNRLVSRSVVDIYELVRLCFLVFAGVTQTAAANLHRLDGRPRVPGQVDLANDLDVLLVGVPQNIDEVFAAVVAGARRVAGVASRPERGRQARRRRGRVTPPSADLGELGQRCD